MKQQNYQCVNCGVWREECNAPCVSCERHRRELAERHASPPERDDEPKRSATRLMLTEGAGI
jgi:hypothetical protein